MPQYLLEFDFFNKDSWTPGEWHSEPDKAYWIDHETGLPCLIIRGPHGSLNGYVGVPIYHPAYGLSYDGSTQHDFDNYLKNYSEYVSNMDITKSITDILDNLDFPEKFTVPLVGKKILEIEVHGGLTFSGPSEVPTKEMWEEYKKRSFALRIEASMFPIGSATRWLNAWSKYLHDYEKWSDAFMAQCIGTKFHNEETWWFGFDCSHSDDLCPRVESSLKLVGFKQEIPHSVTQKTYRNISYVENECKLLAKQLKEITLLNMKS